MYLLATDHHVCRARLDVRPPFDQPSVWRHVVLRAGRVQYAAIALVVRTSGARSTGTPTVRRGATSTIEHINTVLSKQKFLYRNIRVHILLLRVDNIEVGHYTGIRFERRRSKHTCRHQLHFYVLRTPLKLYVWKIKPFDIKRLESYSQVQTVGTYLSREVINGSNNPYCRKTTR